MVVDTRTAIGAAIGVEIVGIEVEVEGVETIIKIEAVIVAVIVTKEVARRGTGTGRGEVAELKRVSTP